MKTLLTVSLYGAALRVQIRGARPDVTREINCLYNYGILTNRTPDEIPVHEVEDGQIVAEGLSSNKAFAAGVHTWAGVLHQQSGRPLADLGVIESELKGRFRHATGWK